MNRSHAILAALLGLVATDALAVDYVFCVGDDVQLEDALAQAPGLAASDPLGVLDIRLRRRPGAPYVLTRFDPQVTAGFGNVKLRGGYSDDPDDTCSEEARIIAAQDTALRFQPSGQPGPLHLHTRGVLLIEGITFDLAHGVRITHDGEYASLSAISNRFGASQSGPALGLEKLGGASEDAQYRVVNNLVAGAEDADRCAVELTGLAANESGNGAIGASAVVANNTLADNAGRALCYRHLAQLTLANNIVWGNGGAVEDTDAASPTPAVLRHNLFQAGSVVPGLQGAHEEALAGDPEFAAAYRLGPGSPAVNSGYAGTVPAGLPAQDLAGQPRKRAAVDRGAFESDIDGVAAIVVDTAGDIVDPDDTITSMREAIEQANAQPGADRIVFDLPAASVCPGPLFLTQPLPDITGSLEVDGFTQAASRPNADPYGFDGVTCIALISAGLSTGLKVAAGQDVSLTLRGVQLAGFDVGLALEGGRDHLVQGNMFGNESLPNGIDVRIGDGVTGVLVGGQDLADGNLIASAQDTAVVVAPGASGNFIMGNVIGPRVDGLEDPGLKNLRGLLLAGSDNRIERNLIRSSDDAGLLIEGSDNAISANQLVSNGIGIRVGALGAGAASDNWLHGNVLAYHAGAGIAIAPQARRNRISADSFYGNTGLAIDLQDDGQIQPEDIDTGAASTEANAGQNHPVLLAAHAAGEAALTAEVSGELESANGDYLLQFYVSLRCHDSGNGEGEDLAGTAHVTIQDAVAGQNGNAAFTATLRNWQFMLGRYVTATATDAAGNTSEFSACQQIASTHLFGDGFE